MQIFNKFSEEDSFEMLSSLRNEEVLFKMKSGVFYANYQLSGFPNYGLTPEAKINYYLSEQTKLL